MKKKLVLGIILVGVLLTVTPVNAMGTAKVSLVSENEVQVGDTFTVRLQVSDIKDTYDGVVSMSGRLYFDKDINQIVSGKGTETPYGFRMNEETKMISGLDFTFVNGIRDTMSVYEFTFKALQEGTANITLEKATLTDSKGYITTTVVDQNVKVKEVAESKKEVIVMETIPSKQEEVISKTEELKNKEVLETKEEIEIKSEKEEKTIIQENVSTSKKNQSVKRKFSSLKMKKVFKNLVQKFKSLL